MLCGKSDVFHYLSELHCDLSPFTAACPAANFVLRTIAAFESHYIINRAVFNIFGEFFCFAGCCEKKQFFLLYILVKRKAVWYYIQKYGVLRRLEGT